MTIGSSPGLLSTVPTSVLDHAAIWMRLPSPPWPRGVAHASRPSPIEKPGSARKPARYSLKGQATFYNNGTTAMRLPRGTVVIICGGGGCIERTVTDYGPQDPARVVDLYKPDFFRICGCPSWSGVTNVTVHVY
jgi:hypothetical protein